MFFPYSDDDMKYDWAVHRYCLTEDCVLRELGIDLRQGGDIAGSANPSTFGIQTLNRVSRFVYNYIYARVIDEPVWERLLAKTPSVRKMLKEMMLSQLDSMYAGQANIFKGEAAFELETIALRMVDEWGVCLTYAGSFNPCYAWLRDKY